MSSIQFISFKQIIIFSNEISNAKEEKNDYNFSLESKSKMKQNILERKTDLDALDCVNKMEITRFFFEIGMMQLCVY